MTPAASPLVRCCTSSPTLSLAGSVACLRPPGVWRWLLLILLLEHGVVTEFVQLFVPDRHGAVPDILIDHGGIALGLALTWPWWRRSSA